MRLPLPVLTVMAVSRGNLPETVGPRRWVDVYKRQDLETPIEGEEDAASSIAHILDTNSTLGIDNRDVYKRQSLMC